MRCFVCEKEISILQCLKIDFLRWDGNGVHVHEECDVSDFYLKSLKGGPLPIQADKYNATSNFISKRSKGQGQSNHKINQRRYK